MRSFNSNENDESVFKLIGDFIQKKEKDALRVINPEKYLCMFTFIYRIGKYLNEIKQDAKIDYNFCVAFNTGTVSIETDYACFQKEKGTMELFSMSDELEVYVIADGNVKLDFTFYDVLKTVNIVKETEHL